MFEGIVIILIKSFLAVVNKMFDCGNERKQLECKKRQWNRNTVQCSMTESVLCYYPYYRVEPSVLSGYFGTALIPSTTAELRVRGPCCSLVSQYTVSTNLAFSSVSVPFVCSLQFRAIGFL